MILNKLRRKIRAKGHGIHSPFAFHFITNVVYDSYWFYAFDDIRNYLSAHQILSDAPKLHHLTYRLVRHFAPRKVLEINSGEGVNTLYIRSQCPDIVCRCIEPDANARNVARILNKRESDAIAFCNEVPPGEHYDAIFVYVGKNQPTDPEVLFEASDNTAFWVVAGINTRTGRRLWRKIVKDNRARITFDVTDIGIVILNRDYLKANYKI